MLCLNYLYFYNDCPSTSIGRYEFYFSPSRLGEESIFLSLSRDDFLFFFFSCPCVDFLLIWYCQWQNFIFCPIVIYLLYQWLNFSFCQVVTNINSDIRLIPAYAFISFIFLIFTKVISQNYEKPNQSLLHCNSCTNDNLSLHPSKTKAGSKYA